jgi:predicted RNase H-like HicB family nuclease
MEFDVFITPPDVNNKKWIAFSPAFPGCRGYGDTKEEAIKSFKVSLNKCINTLINLVPE